MKSLELKQLPVPLGMPLHCGFRRFTQLFRSLYGHVVCPRFNVFFSICSMDNGFKLSEAAITIRAKERHRYMGKEVVKWDIKGVITSWKD